MRNVLMLQGVPGIWSKAAFLTVLAQAHDSRQRMFQVAPAVIKLLDNAPFTVRKIVLDVTEKFAVMEAVCHADRILKADVSKPHALAFLACALAAQEAPKAPAAGFGSAYQLQEGRKILLDSSMHR